MKTATHEEKAASAETPAEVRALEEEEARDSGIKKPDANARQRGGRTTTLEYVDTSTGVTIQLADLLKALE